MMWDNLKIIDDTPAYQQIEAYIAELIKNGLLPAGVRLPSTRELAQILKVSRNTVILAYEELHNLELIRNIRGQGAFVNANLEKRTEKPGLEWLDWINEYGKSALDMVRTARKFPRQAGMISFNSLAPDESIFEVEELKRAFLNRIALEGEKLLNYGETKGYRPLITWLKRYLEGKGVDFDGKDILITTGFMEGFTLILAALTKPGQKIVCENPTHNLALNAMKLAGLDIVGIRLNEDGIDLQELEAALMPGTARLGFIMPSYHNPTGLVMTSEKRLRVLELFEKYQLPLVEEGFNEELRYSGSHLSPLLALAGKANHVVYLGSFAKILFPAIRIGWVIGDAKFIACLESIKLHRNIYTSPLDQAVFYEYLQNGKFQQYLKRAKKLYKEKYEQAIQLAKEYIPCRRIWGDGGLHLFIELDGVSAKQLLTYCYERGVLFTPGEIFYSDGSGFNTFRLSISQVEPGEMEKGFKIIGEGVRELNLYPAS
jgi:DNA-binding transcriptional MocR family regulator